MTFTHFESSIVDFFTPNRKTVFHWRCLYCLLNHHHLFLWTKQCQFTPCVLWSMSFCSRIFQILQSDFGVGKYPRWAIVFAISAVFWSWNKHHRSLPGKPLRLPGVLLYTILYVDEILIPMSNWPHPNMEICQLKGPELEVILTLPFTSEIFPFFTIIKKQFMPKPLSCNCSKNTIDQREYLG